MRSMTGPVPVLIVDDQAPFRRAARAVVDRDPGFEVVGEAETGEEAVELADALAPGLVLMDINLPGHQRHRGHPPHHRRAPRRGRDAALDLPGRRPPRRRRRRAARPAYVHKEEFGPAVVRDLWAAHSRSAERHGRRRQEPSRAGSGRVIRVPCAGRRLDRERAADRADAVAHVHEAVAALRAGARGRSRRRRRRPRSSSAPSSSRTVTIACAPSPACFAAFCSASRQQK